MLVEIKRNKLLINAAIKRIFFQNKCGLYKFVIIILFSIKFSDLYRVSQKQNGFILYRVIQKCVDIILLSWTKKKKAHFLLHAFATSLFQKFLPSTGLSLKAHVLNY